MRRLVTITLGWTLATAGSAGLAVAAVGVVAHEVVAPRSPLAIVTAVGADGTGLLPGDSPVHATGAVRDLGRPPAEVPPPAPFDHLDLADGVDDVPEPSDLGEADASLTTASRSAGSAGAAEVASAADPSSPARPSGGEGADAEPAAPTASGPSRSTGSSSGTSTVRRVDEEPAPAAAPPPGSTSGSSSGARPAPPAPAEPAGERRTYRLELGTVTVSFAPGDVHVVQYTASCDACTVTVEQRGDDRVRVEFTSDGHTSRLEARWHRDAPEAEVRERSSGKARKDA